VYFTSNLLLNSENLHKTTQMRQIYDIKKLNQKLVMENAIIVSQQRKKIVIINAEEYSKKVHTFITDKIPI